LDIISTKTEIKQFKWQRFFSIRWKLMLIYLFISLVPFLFYYLVIVNSIRDYYQGDREDRMRYEVHLIASRIAVTNYFDYLDDEDMRQDIDIEIVERSIQGTYRILILDNQGLVLNDSNNAYVGSTKIIPEVITALLEGRRVANIRPLEEAVYAAVAIENANDDVVGAVLLVSSIEDIYQSVTDIQQSIIMYTLLTTFVVCVLVFAVSQVLIDPLSSISDVVQKMSDGHLDRRIDIRGYDEYAKLAQAFNEMAEKLEMVDKTRQEFVSNVSHELKTPLSSIKVLSESILLQEDVPVQMHREFLQDINSEIDRMARVINDLLQLVKLDEGELGLKVKPVNINNMVIDILRRLNPLAEQKDIKLLIEEPREVVADVDEVKLSSAISNLVDNAIKYTRDGGDVKIIVDADHQNVFVSILDTGIGINEADQGKIFERFYRVDKTRDRETGGTGLGLSITMATLRLHNGSIRVTSKENEGSTFIVRIPIHYSGKG